MRWEALHRGERTRQEGKGTNHTRKEESRTQPAAGNKEDEGAQDAPNGEIS